MGSSVNSASPSKNCLLVKSAGTWLLSNPFMSFWSVHLTGTSIEKKMYNRYGTDRRPREEYGSSRDSRGSHPYRRHNDGDHRRDKREYSRRYNSGDLGFDRPRSRDNRDGDRRSGYDRSRDERRDPRDRPYESRDNDLNIPRTGNGRERGFFEDNYGRPRSVQRDRYQNEGRYNSNEPDSGFGNEDYNLMDIPRRQDMDYQENEYKNRGFQNPDTFNNRFIGAQPQEEINFDRNDMLQQNIGFYETDMPQNDYGRSRSPQNMDYMDEPRQGDYQKGRSPPRNRRSSISGDHQRSRSPRNSRDRSYIDENAATRYIDGNKELYHGSLGKETSKVPDKNAYISKLGNTARNVRELVEGPNIKSNAKAGGNMNKEENKANKGHNVKKNTPVVKPAITQVQSNFNKSSENNVSANVNQTKECANSNTEAKKTQAQNISIPSDTELEEAIEEEEANEVVLHDGKTLDAHVECDINNDKIFSSQLDNTSKMVLMFLNQVMFKGLVKGNLYHCCLLGECYLNHRNAKQLLLYEVRKLMDLKPIKKSPGMKREWTADEIEKLKRAKLVKSKELALEEIHKRFGDCTEGEKAAREKLVNDCLDKIVATEFSKDLIPKPDDYTVDPNVKINLDDVRHKMQWEFIVNSYQLIGFQVIDEKPPQAEIEDLIKLHLESGTLAALVVECIRNFEPKGKKVKPGDNVVLSGQPAKILKNASKLCYLRDINAVSIYKRQVNRNMRYQTEIMDLLPTNEDLSTTFIRDFANMVLFFDQVMTVVRYKLVEYSPQIIASPAVKMQVFEELVKSVYTEAFKIWKSGVPLSERTFDWLTSIKMW